MSDTESEAIKQVLAGDRDAYRVLVDDYYPFAFRIAFASSAMRRTRRR